MFGVSVRFDFFFFVAVVLFLLADTTGMAVLLLCAAAIHEGCHLLAMAALGVPVCAVDFTAFGMKIERRDLRLQSYGREALITLAGGAGNLLTALVLAHSPLLPLELLGAFSLVLGCLNLLPVAGLDGGRLVHDLLCLLVGQGPARRVTGALTALVLAVLWCLFGWWCRSRGINWMLAVFCAYLTASALRDFGPFRPPLGPSRDWHLNRKRK